jgi:hypothetical protein
MLPTRTLFLDFDSRWIFGTTGAAPPRPVVMQLQKGASFAAAAIRTHVRATSRITFGDLSTDFLPDVLTLARQHRYVGAAGLQTRLRSASAARFAVTRLAKVLGVEPIHLVGAAAFAVTCLAKVVCLEVISLVGAGPFAVTCLANVVCLEVISLVGAGPFELTPLAKVADLMLTRLAKALCPELVNEEVPVAPRGPERKSRFRVQALR